jgi:hypothetical protein
MIFVILIGLPLFLISYNLIEYIFFPKRVVRKEWGDLLDRNGISEDEYVDWLKKTHYEGSLRRLIGINPKTHPKEIAHKPAPPKGQCPLR